MSLGKFFNNLSIRLKIIVVGVIVSVITLIPLLFSAYYSSMDLVKDSAISQAKSLHRILTLSLKQQSIEAAEIADLVSEYPAVKSFVLNNKTGAVYNSVFDRIPNDRADIIIVVDKNGNILADKNNQKRVGEKFSSLSNLIEKSMLQKRDASSIDVINKNDIVKEGNAIVDRVNIKRKATEGSKEGYVNKDVEEDAMINTVISPIFGPGNKSVIGAVIVGNILNNNFKFVDEVNDNQEGMAITIFKDDLRIATTVKKNGKRAVGTLLSAKVVDKVLIGKQNFEGRALVVGQPYWSYYTPIYNSQDQVIGSLFTAMSENKLMNIFMQGFGIKILISVIFIAIVSCVLLVFIANYISTPINKLTNISKELAKNNFALDVETNTNKDEIGELTRAIDNYVCNFRNFLSRISSSTQDVSSGSEQINIATEQTAIGAQQITSNISQLAQGTQEQSSNVMQSLESVNEISEEAKVIVNNADNAVRLSNTTELDAKEGYNQAIAAINKINKLKTSTLEVSENINELGKLGSRIEVIVELIKNIAGQTNLLALNAAIEAARAGEHGKGFAVVADEVKKLAGKSAEATDDITNMIKEIQNRTTKAVITMEANVKEVDDDVVTIDNVGKSLDKILSAATDTSKYIQEISEEINKLSDNSDNIVRMMENISSISEETAASTEEISSITEEQSASLQEINASSQTLSKLAEDLKQQVAVFKIHK